MGDHSAAMQEMRIERERQTMGMTPQAPNNDQLTRDQLLQQRLWAASGSADAVAEMLADLTKTPPHASEEQEQRVRDIESSLSAIRWNCTRLKDFVGKGDKT